MLILQLFFLFQFVSKLNL